MKYDEFLTEERNKLRKKQLELEEQHKLLNREKYKPITISSPKNKLGNEDALRRKIKERVRRLKENDRILVRNCSFPFGMIQTPYLIMANRPVKFRNNKEDNPAQFLEEFIQIFLDERLYEEINSKIKFQNQKEEEDIHSFLTGIRKLFTKLYPRKSLK